MSDRSPCRSSSVKASRVAPRPRQVGRRPVSRAPRRARTNHARFRKRKERKSGTGMVMIPRMYTRRLATNGVLSKVLTCTRSVHVCGRRCTRQSADRDSIAAHLARTRRRHRCRHRHGQHSSSVLHLLCFFRLTAVTILTSGAIRSRAPPWPSPISPCDSYSTSRTS